MIMSLFRLHSLVLVVAFAAICPPASAQSIDTISYSIGMSLGQKLRAQGASTLDINSFAQAVETILKGDDPILDSRYSDSLNYAYFQLQRDKMFDKAKEEGTQFLQKNALRAEVTTTTSGLQYEVLVAKEGPKPEATSTVTVHYVGMLLNGDMFDSSVDRGEPATFPLNRVIKGWTEGLQLMSTGEKYRFYLPYDLAYGSRGAGAEIPPYSTLIFDVELLSWK